MKNSSKVGISNETLWHDGGELYIKTGISCGKSKNSEVPYRCRREWWQKGVNIPPLPVANNL